MKRQRHKTFGWCLLACALVAAAAGLRYIHSPGLETHRSEPVGIMGTHASLTVVVRAGQTALADNALKAAEAALRRIEALMSHWLEQSEVALLNAAKAGEIVYLSPDTMEVLRKSQQFAQQTQGAFDVTCRPIIEMWKRAGKENRVPSEVEIAAAIENTGWRHIELLDGKAQKKIDGAGVDLGGVAKGYGVDKAVEAMKAAGALGGTVEVGGDIGCFGRKPDGKNWIIGVRDPFETKQVFCRLSMGDLAVCTSGNYFRFVTIEGRRYSHIVDPRSGRPVDAAPSVTVVAPNTTVADAWATGLSVLGPDGFKLIPPGSGIEAMIVTGDAREHRVHTTPGFNRLILEER